MLLDKTDMLADLNGLVSVRKVAEGDLSMKCLNFIAINDLFDYNFGNTPLPPLYNVPTRGSSL